MMKMFVLCKDYVEPLNYCVSLFGGSLVNNRGGGGRGRLSLVLNQSH